MFDPKDFFDWFGAVVIALGGWIMKRFSDDLKDLQGRITRTEANLHLHEVHVAKGYVTRAELKDCMDNIDEKLDKIYNKLDTKQDKPDRRG